MIFTKLHRYEQRQVIPISREQAWEFFSDSRNLEALTPREMGFETLSGDEEPMYVGQIIIHRIRLAPMLRARWVTEITAMQTGHYFIDEQRFGPYKFWQHLHRFTEVEGGVEVHDRIHYAMPLSPFGSIGQPMIQNKLDMVFGYRREKLKELMG